MTNLKETNLIKINQVRVQLKQMFIGLDEIIDRLVDNVQILFLEPELVNQPIIVNLFGLPAVGKTTLIRAFIKLMDAGHSFAEIDVRKLTNYSLVDALEDTLGEERSIDCQGKPLFILLDEFHNLTREGNSFMDCYDLWNFMSDGKIPNNLGEKIKNVKFFLSLMTQYDINFTQLDEKLTAKDRKSQAISQLQRAIYKFTADNKFKLSAKSDDFVSRNSSEEFEIDKLLDEDDEEEEETNEKYTDVDSADNVESEKIEPFDLLKQSYSKMLYVAVKHFCNTGTDFSFDQYYGLEPYGVSSFIDNNVDKNKLNSEYDFSKSVMFICGNFYTFDYALYGHSSLYDADQLREITAAFTVRQLRESLSTKLSPEQLNRLGSTFLLLPSFGKVSFETLITLKLDWFRELVIHNHKFNLSFHSSIATYLYNRGVSPLEGFRPLNAEIASFVSVGFGLVVKSIADGNDSGRLWFNETTKTVELQSTNNFYQSHKNQSFIDDAVDQEVMLLNSIEVAAQVMIYAKEFRSIPKQIVVGVNKNQDNILQLHEAIDSYKIRIAKIKFTLAPSILATELFGEEAPLIYSKDLAIAANMLQDLVVNHQFKIEEQDTYIREFNRIGKDVREQLAKFFKENRTTALNLIDFINQSNGPVDNTKLVEFLKTNGFFVIGEQEFVTSAEKLKFSSLLGKTSYSLALSLIKGE